MRRTTAIAATAFAVIAALTLAALAFRYLNRDLDIPEGFGFRGSGALFAGTFATVGFIIAARRSDNPIGWLMLLGGFSGAVQAVANEYATYAIVTAPGAVPFGYAIASLQSWAYVPLVGATIYVFLLFPGGQLVSTRWRPIAWLVPISVALYSLGDALVPGPLNNLPAVRNPVVIPESLVLWAFAALALGYAMSMVALTAAVLSLIVRFRRARGEERAQLRWIAMAALVLAATALPSTGNKIFEYLSIAAFCAFSLSIAVAILKYRLYDIDLIINRTAVYGATSATIALTFFAGIVALQTVLRPLTSGSELAVAASTLISFALFQSVRRRVQDAVDRRFDRSRYDAARTLESFADRLRDEVDIDALRADLIAAVRQTMTPAHTSLWLRETHG